MEEGFYHVPQAERRGTMSSFPKSPAEFRLVPHRPFPPYSFVPGRFPHPTSDSTGHSFGVEPFLPTSLDPQHWGESETYLYGIDLFNGRYYWESHVAWESLWLGC